MEISRLRRSAVLAIGLGLAGAAAWAGTLTVRPGVPSVGGLARYTGNHGLEVNVAVPDRSAAFVQTNHPSAEATYRVRFSVNLRRLAIGEGEEVDLFAAYDGADPVPPTLSGNALLRVVVRRSGGVNLLTAFARRDNGTEAEIPAAVPLAHGWRVIELDWARAAAGSNNGRLGLWVDGTARAGLTGLDNDASGINYARWGTVNGVDPGTSGTILLDDFASQRTGYIGPPAVFGDVPSTQSYWPHVQGLYAAEITAGCAAGSFCPNSLVTRAEMAAFLVRGMRGPDFTPPAATGIFSDVPTSFWGAPWIEQLYRDGLTAGCGTNPLRYCPSNTVSRAEIAVFLLKAYYRSGSYTPPPANGDFADVPVSSWAAPWIEQLAAVGITAGCGGNNYCPSSAVTRWQMAIFLVRTFNLPTQQVGP
jgi:hypothetical protein